MPVKKVAEKVVEKVVEKTPAQIRAEKVSARNMAWRKKRERVHTGLINANVEKADA